MAEQARSYDGLDNKGVPSADRIPAEFQQVQVGDIFPMTPTADDRFVVRAVEPERAGSCLTLKRLVEAAT